MMHNDRFWAKVKKADGDGCWEWQAALNDKGYGVTTFEDTAKTTKAHRRSWEFANGPIPDGLCVLHKCDNPKCVKPDHLFLGTRAENNRDMFQKGRARPHRVAGWNRKEIPPHIVERIGKVPDHILASEMESDKCVIQRYRKENGIKSYAEQTGNNGQMVGRYFRKCYNEARA